MKRTFYDKDMDEQALFDIFNSEDYWQGKLANWQDGVFKDYETKQAYFDKVADKIRSCVRTSRPILEIGCGVGYLVNALQKRGFSAFGVDVSSWAVAHAIAPNIQRKSLFDFHPPLGRNFGLVFSHDVLEHIPAQFLPLAVRILRGLGQRNYHIISCGSLPDDRDPTHVTMHTLGWWKRRLPAVWMVEMKDRVDFSIPNKVEVI